MNSAVADATRGFPTASPALKPCHGEIREAPGNAPSEAESLGAIGSRVSQAVELFSQAVVLGLERFDALMQRRDQNLDFINRVFWRDVL